MEMKTTGELVVDHSINALNERKNQIYKRLQKGRRRWKCPKLQCSGSKGFTGSRGRAGANGKHAGLGHGSGGHGGDGTDGQDGYDGVDGCDGDDSPGANISVSRKDKKDTADCDITLQIENYDRRHDFYLGDRGVLIINARGADGGNAGRGGDGGIGGNGGNGTPGCPGRDGRKGDDGADGGSGGDGGNGGHGGNGGTGGNGGKGGAGGAVIVKSDDPKLFVLIEIDALGGQPGNLGEGGHSCRGGKGGQSGEGGKGGKAGPPVEEIRVIQEKQDNDNTVTKAIVEVSKVWNDGIDGKPGSKGQPGLTGRDGCKGRNGFVGEEGSVLFTILDKDGYIVESGDNRFDAGVVSYTYIDENHDGIFEPGEHVIISQVVVRNIGGVVMPPGAQLRFPSTKTIESSDEVHTITESVYPSEDYTVPAEFRNHIPELQHATRNKHHHRRHTFISQMTMLNRLFLQSEVESEIEVQYPVHIENIESPKFVGPYEPCSISVFVKNISSRTYGGNSRSKGRTSKKRGSRSSSKRSSASTSNSTHGPSDLDFSGSAGDVMIRIDTNEYLSLKEAKNNGYIVRSSPTSQTKKVSAIPSGDVGSCRFDFMLTDFAETILFDETSYKITLLLRGKPIEQHTVSIKVVPEFSQKPSTDVILVTHAQVSRAEYLAWTFLFATLNLSFNVWHVERYNGLSQTDKGLTWVGRCRFLILPLFHGGTSLDLLEYTDFIEHFDQHPDQGMLMLGDAVSEKILRFQYDFLRPQYMVGAGGDCEKFEGWHICTTPDVTTVTNYSQETLQQVAEKDHLYTFIANIDMDIKRVGLGRTSYGKLFIHKSNLSRTSQLIVMEKKDGHVAQGYAPFPKDGDGYHASTRMDKDFYIAFFSVLHMLPVEHRMDLLMGSKNVVSWTHGNQIISLDDMIYASLKSTIERDIEVGDESLLASTCRIQRYLESNPKITWRIAGPVLGALKNVCNLAFWWVPWSGLKPLHKVVRRMCKVTQLKLSYLCGSRSNAVEMEKSIRKYEISNFCFPLEVKLPCLSLPERPVIMNDLAQSFAEQQRPKPKKRIPNLPSPIRSTTPDSEQSFYQPIFCDSVRQESKLNMISSPTIVVRRPVMARPGAFVLQYVNGIKKTSLVENTEILGHNISPAVKLRIIKYETSEDGRPLSVFSFNFSFGGLRYVLEGRYSEMLRIHNELQEEIDRVFKRRTQKPIFPPKSYITSVSERAGEILWIRAEKLELYYQLLFSNTRMLKSDELHNALGLDTYGRMVIWETSQMMENESVRTKNAENADIKWFDAGRRTALVNTIE